MRKYFFFLKKYYKKLILLSIVVLISSIINIMLTFLSGAYLDVLVENATLQKLYLLCLLFLGASCVNLVLQYLISYIMTPTTEKLIFDIKVYLLKHLRSIPVLKYKEYNVAYLSKRIEDDSRIISQFFIDNYISLIIKGIEIVAIFVLVFSINSYVSALMFIFLPIYFMVYKKMKKTLFDKNMIAREKSNTLFQDYTYQLEYMEESIINANFENDDRILDEKFGEYINSIHSLVKVNNRMTCSQNFIIVAMNICVFVVGGISVINGNTTVGGLSILMSYFMQLIKNITYYIQLGQKYQSIKASLHRIDEILNIPVTSNGKNLCMSIEHIEANISFEIMNQQILSNVIFESAIGDVIGIIGGNGSGKSTLTKVLMGIYDSNSKIVINDKTNMNDIDLFCMRRESISYVPQKISYRDVAVADVFEQEGIQKYEQLIELFLGLGITFSEKELGFIRGNWTKRVNELSGGDQQFISILHTVIKQKKVLIFDEPTANLDFQRVEFFCKVINNLKGNKMIFIISHDNELDKLFTRKIKLTKL